MSQDSFNRGVEFKWRGLGGHRQLRAQIPRSHHRGHRSAGERQRGLRYANPGEGSANEALLSTATARSPCRRRSGSTTRCRSRWSVRGNWFMGRELRLEPPLRQLRGSSNSDEISTPTLGVFVRDRSAASGQHFRPGSNANRAWDLDESMWDAHGHLDPQGASPPIGRTCEATGRPSCHSARRSARTSMPGSGTPLSTYVTR